MEIKRFLTETLYKRIQQVYNNQQNLIDKTKMETKNYFDDLNGFWWFSVHKRWQKQVGKVASKSMFVYL